MKQNKLLMIVGITCAVCVVAMVIILGVTSIPKMGEFTPPPFDDAAMVGTPPLSMEEQESLGWSVVAPKGSPFTAAACGRVTVSDGKALLWFANTDTNTVLLKLRMFDAKGNVLGETGLIRPGEYVQYVTLSKIPDVGDEVVMKIMSYNPDTYLSEGAFQMRTAIYQ